MGKSILEEFIERKEKCEEAAAQNPASEKYYSTKAATWDEAIELLSSMTNDLISEIEAATFNSKEDDSTIQYILGITRAKLQKQSLWSKLMSERRDLDG